MGPTTLRLFRRSRSQSIIRLRGARDRDQIVIEVVCIVLGADRLEQWIARFSPALEHVKRLVERVGVLDLDEGLEDVAFGEDLVTFDDVQLFGVRRAEVIDVAVLGLQPDGVDDELSVLKAADRFTKPRGLYDLRVP